MNDLTELRAVRTQRYEGKRDARLKKYHDEALTWLPLIDAEISGLSSSGPSVQKLAEKMLAKYPVATEHDPLPVKQAIYSLRSACLGAIDVLAQNPGWLEKMRDKITGRTFEDFIDVSPSVRLDIDRRDLFPLLGNAKAMQGTPDEIRSLAKRVDDEIKKALERERQNAGDAVSSGPNNRTLTAPVDGRQLKVNSSFDPRR